MKFQSDIVTTSDIEPDEHGEPERVQVSGQDIARQLMVMREAARAAGLEKVVLCLDYAYYEAMRAGREDVTESAEAL